MSMSNTFENNLLQHIFQNADITLIGDAAGLRGSVAPGSLYISLHTADPGEAGDQSTNEANYTGYARVAVPRTGVAWNVVLNVVSNLAAITFGQCTAGANTITHIGIGTSSAGAGKLLYKSTLGNSFEGPFTATAADVITIPGHSFAVNDKIALYPVLGSDLPGGITEGQQYFVKTVSGNDITISTTQGGATLDITTAGDGLCIKAASLAISAGITPEFGIGNLSVTVD